MLAASGTPAYYLFPCQAFEGGTICYRLGDVAGNMITNVGNYNDPRMWDYFPCELDAEGTPTKILEKITCAIDQRRELLGW